MSGVGEDGLPPKGAKLEKPPAVTEAGEDELGGEWHGISDGAESGEEHGLGDDGSGSESGSDDSLMGDLLGLEQDGVENYEACTPEEGALLRKQLHTLGPVAFVEHNIDSGRYTLAKLLTAFGVHLPDVFDDDTYVRLLSAAFRRELAKRQKLEDVNTVDDVVALIAASANIAVITGAGISTSLGIPDFRSKGTGLYAKLAHLGLDDPQEVFDIRTFREDPTIFYSVAGDILPGGDRFTPTHRFIAMLHERGKLLTNYSQNIDNLEARAGVPREKLIQCHGSFGGAVCMSCGWECEGERLYPEIRAGRVPRCEVCTGKRKREDGGESRMLQKKKKQKKKRGKSRGSSGSDDEEEEEGYQSPSAGVMKPTITFFGEDLPDDFHTRLRDHDRDKVDLCIVIGTSLKVSPVSEMADFLPPGVPQVYISREPVRHVNFDVDLLGECDVVVEELCRRLGWPMDHEMCEGGRGEVSVTPAEGVAHRWVFEWKDEGEQRAKQDDEDRG